MLCVSVTCVNSSSGDREYLPTTVDQRLSAATGRHREYATGVAGQQRSAASSRDREYSVLEKNILNST